MQQPPLPEEDSDMNPAASLDLIRHMISAARNDHRENGWGWLFWGWLLFGASVASVIVMQSGQRGYLSSIWTGMLVAGLLVYFGAAFLRPRKEVVRTFISDLLQKLGTGFFISLLTMVFASFIIESHLGFGYYYILYAFWMFIQGSALRFKPLLVGAFVNWMAAIAIFLIADFYFTMIISSVAVLVGYLIPGYLLRQQYKKSVTLH
jgi:hypothetical protein